MRRSLTKAEILRHRADIRSLFAEGIRFSSTGAKLVVRKNGLGYSRVLISPARKFGSSVERNHIRRICKDIIRLEKSYIGIGLDVGVIVFPGFGQDYHTWETRLHKLLSRALQDKRLADTPKEEI